MSGHSKWSKIKRQKGAADHKRGQVFTKLGKAITIAAKQGGGDMDMNFSLRLAVQKAKAANVPKDNIERAIRRGTGESGGETYEELLYEGFGPDNGAVIIHVLTDNKNRTVSQLKHLLSKKGGGLASNGSVMWQFEHRGVILLEGASLNESLENTILESGAIDYSSSLEGIEVITQPEDLESVKNSIEAAGATVTAAELSYIPKETIQTSNPAGWDAFLEALGELDDVNEVFTNVYNDKD